MRRFQPLISCQWDWDTSIEEVMNGLHHLVASGKVLYLVSGIVEDCIRRTHILAGHFGHARMDRVQGEHVRTAHGQDALRHLPGRMEHPPTRL